MVKINDIIATMHSIKRVYVSQEVAQVCVSIAQRTRNHPNILLGVSTRGLVHLVSCAKALAYFRGRDFVVPEDIFELSVHCLAHRIVVRDQEQPDSLIREIVDEVRATVKI